MPTKRLIVPDGIPFFHTENKANADLRLLQYTNATTYENFDTFLTHHALVYVLHGIKQIRVAESSYRIEPGQLLLIPKGEYLMSEYMMEKEGFQSIMLFLNSRVVRDILAQLEPSLLQNSLLSSDSSLHPIICIIPETIDITAVFRTLQTYACSQTPFLSELVKIKLIELVYLLLNSSFKYSLLAFLLAATRDEKPDIAAVIERYLYTSVTVKELATLSGRSISSFKRNFSEYYKLPPHQWMNEKRMERAAYLLRTTGKGIEQVAEESGYISNAHFARLFKQHYLLTPTEYRTEQTKK